MAKELTRMDVKKEIALMFQSVFAKPDGMIVLKELKKLAQSDKVIVPLDNQGRIDPLEVMRNEGKRAMIMHIEKQINKTFNEPKQERAEL
jgi:hypothetical protein